ncbi:MAG TPA: R3H domain-containing nucleic acid-binding protein [Pontimonas sp.]|jgi:spoIIIJ-associated protein|nr:R3H domain-containing nucleic acid-binding protein [Pontimonas sp.]
MATKDSEIVVPDEGELAADYLENLLDIADLDGDIEIEVRQERTYVTVGSAETNDLDPLSAPDVVNALQDLTRLAVQQKTGEFARLVLDIGGSREAREKELEKLVTVAIDKIENGAKSAALPPMSSYERKLVHDMVGDRGFQSGSEGEGKDRHTVITAAS